MVTQANQRECIGILQHPPTRGHCAYRIYYHRYKRLLVRLVVKLRRAIYARQPAAIAGVAMIPPNDWLPLVDTFGSLLEGDHIFVGLLRCVYPRLRTLGVTAVTINNLCAQRRPEPKLKLVAR